LVDCSKVLNGKPLGDEFQSAGDSVFGNGWRFQFNLIPSEPGSVYLLSVGPGKDGTPEYNILFPLPGVGASSAQIGANKILKSRRLTFVDQTGLEKLWIIWSVQEIPELNTIFSNAAHDENNPGTITSDDEIAKVETYLALLRDTAHSQVSPNKENKRTSVKGRGDILVAVVELPHEAY